MEGRHKEGSAKLRERKKVAFQANASKCGEMTDMFSTAGPSSAPVADDGAGGDIGPGSGFEQHRVKTPR